MNKSNLLFLHKLFIGLAYSLIKVFVPLLIYQKTGDMFLSIMFLVVNFGINIFLFYALKKLVQKYGILCIMLHIIPIIVSEFLLLGQINIVVIIVLALLDSIATVLFYAASNIIFSNLDDKSNIAKFEAGQKVGNIIVTLLSAYVLGNIVNSLLFIVIASSLLLVCSIIPLFFVRKELSEIYNNKNKETYKTINKHFVGFNFYHAFCGAIWNFIEVILPLYLYENGINLAFIGVVMAGICIMNIFASFLSQMFDKKKLTPLSILISTIGIVACTLIIMFTKNLLVVQICNVLLSFFFVMIFIVMLQRFIKHSKIKGYQFESLIQRDVYQNLLRTILWATFLIFRSFTLLFVLAIISAIGFGVTAYISYKKYPIDEK